MAEAEFLEQVEKEDGVGDPVVQIHRVRLEVERVRTETAKSEKRLSDRIGEEVGKVRTELSARIDGVEKSMRAWMGIGFSFIAVVAVSDVCARPGSRGDHRVRRGSWFATAYPLLHRGLLTRSLAAGLAGGGVEPA